MAATSMEQQLITGQSATLVGYPPVEKQASAVTARVGTPKTALPDTGSAGTVDSLSTTTAQSAKRGDDSLPLSSSVTVVEGRQYVVVDVATGSRLVVRAAAGGSTTDLRMASPLTMDIAAGSAVLGYAVTYALTSDVVGTDVGRGVALWQATIDGVVYAWSQDLRVVRRSVAYNLTAADVEQLSPYCVSMRPTGDKDWRESLQAAWALYIVPPMLMQGIQPERIISWEVVNPWHLAALEYHLAKTTPDPDPDMRDEKKAALADMRNQVLGSMRFWVDIADDVAPPVDNADESQDFGITFTTR